MTTMIKLVLDLDEMNSTASLIAMTLMIRSCWQRYATSLSERVSMAVAADVQTLHLSYALSTSLWTMVVALGRYDFVRAPTYL